MKEYPFLFLVWIFFSYFGCPHYFLTSCIIMFTKTTTSYSSLLDCGRFDRLSCTRCIKSDGHRLQIYKKNLPQNCLEDWQLMLKFFYTNVFCSIRRQKVQKEPHVANATFRRKKLLKFICTKIRVHRATQQSIIPVSFHSHTRPFLLAFKKTNAKSKKKIKNFHYIRFWYRYDLK